MNITKSVRVEIEPHEVAALYWQMDSDQQAIFWNHLAVISMHRLCLQTAYLAGSNDLSPGGREAILTIAEHFKEK